MKFIKENLRRNLEHIVEILKERELSLATVESCSGGLLSASITEIEGVSQVFRGAVVAYQRLIKERLLGLDPSHLDRRGTIDLSITYELAKSGMRIFDTDLCVGITCAAGPTSPHPWIKKGDAFVSVVSRWGVISRSFHFNGDRSGVRWSVIESSIMMIHELLTSRV